VAPAVGVAAGVVLAREAGARVVDHDGSEHTTDSAATIAASPGVCEELLAILADAYGAGGAPGDDPV
jgi:myo-inositol-1(or 4)-monophosphatase